MAERAATAGQGKGRQGGDPPVARQLHSWQGGLYKQTCVVVNKKTCAGARFRPEPPTFGLLGPKLNGATGANLRTF